MGNQWKGKKIVVENTSYTYACSNWDVVENDKKKSLKCLERLVSVTYTRFHGCEQKISK